MLHVGASNFNGLATYSNDGCIKLKDNAASRDVIGHEWSHAIDDNEGELIYSNASGALDESFADFFGCMQDTDWLIGEESGNAFRNLANPPQFGNPPHPDHFNNFFFTTSDSGGVHTNSGIPNKVAFLVTDGGVHNGFVITGMGRDKATDFYYHVLVDWVGGSTNFDDARNAFVVQAGSWALAGTHGFTFNDLCQVRNAWASVGIGEGDTDCDGVGNFSEDDNDADNIPDSSDNCPNISNFGQWDSDGDGLGNDCDNDDDDDGIPDDGSGSGVIGDKTCFSGLKTQCDDNCISKPNADQADVDGDGIGDVCDDGDKDGFIDSADNCPNMYNPPQTDSDGDGTGNACDTDDDDDGDLDASDNCPLVPNSNQADGDGDGVGDVCDNCPTVPNSSQKDCNGNGLGAACDFSEAIYDENCDLPTAVNLFVPIEDIVTLPCADCTGDWLNPDYIINITARVPSPGLLKVMDEQGHVVGRAKINASGLQVISFHPLAGFFYRAPGSEEQHYQGKKYFLLHPASHGREGEKMSVKIEGALEAAHDQ
jgi:hypothetical protein